MTHATPAADAASPLPPRPHQAHRNIAEWASARLFDTVDRPVVQRPDTAQILHGPVREAQHPARQWRRRLVMLWIERAYTAALRSRRRNDARIRRLARQRQRARAAWHSSRGML